MSDAMGRSLGNVLFGAFGKVQAGAAAVAGNEGRTVRTGSIDDLATLLAYSRRVIIVPGYGLAVAQAQHAVRELAELLEKRGVEVNYAIHPVAGRMPGHMNALLAGQPDLRHADPQRRRGEEHRVHEALDAAGVRRHRQ